MSILILSSSPSRYSAYLSVVNCRESKI